MLLAEVQSYIVIIVLLLCIPQIGSLLKQQEICSPLLALDLQAVVLISFPSTALIII